MYSYLTEPNLTWQETSPLIHFSYGSVYHSPPASIAQDDQGVREAVHVVVSQVQGDGVVELPSSRGGLGGHKAPESLPPLEICQDWHPLQQERKQRRWFSSLMIQYTTPKWDSERKENETTLTIINSWCIWQKWQRGESGFSRVAELLPLMLQVKR